MLFVVDYRYFFIIIMEKMKSFAIPMQKLLHSLQCPSVVLHGKQVFSLIDIKWQYREVN